MINHIYTLLLNRSGATLVNPLLYCTPDFVRLKLPAELAALDTILYGDASTVQLREERALSWLAFTLTPELKPYAFRFDSRNTYGTKPRTLMDMCTTAGALKLPAARLDQLRLAVHSAPGLFVNAAMQSDLDQLQRLYHQAPDVTLVTGAVVLGYCYQLEALRRKAT